MFCLASRGRNVLAAVGGLGIVGVLVVVLIVIAIIYFVRRGRYGDDPAERSRAG